ncbi:hypothetical protein [Priestia aryabhattai]
MKKRYIASIVAASSVLTFKAIKKAKEKEGVDSVKELLAVKKLKIAADVTKEQYKNFKQEAKIILNGGSEEDLAEFREAVEAERNKRAIKVEPLVLEDLSYEPDKEVLEVQRHLAELKEAENNNYTVQK